MTPPDASNRTGRFLRRDHSRGISIVAILLALGVGIATAWVATRNAEREPVAEPAIPVATGGSTAGR